MDVAQAVVARVAAAALELDLSRGNVELVMRHEHFVWRDLEEAGKCAYGLARGIHEGLGFEQPDRVAAHIRACHQAEVAALGHERDFQVARQFVDPPESGVVSCGFVLGAGIAQANKQFDHEGALSGKVGRNMAACIDAPGACSRDVRSRKQNGPPKWAARLRQDSRITSCLQASSLQQLLRLERLLPRQEP